MLFSQHNINEKLKLSYEEKLRNAWFGCVSTFFMLILSIIQHKAKNGNG